MKVRLSIHFGVQCMVFVTLAGCCARRPAQPVAAGLLAPRPISALQVIREKCQRCHAGENPPAGLDLSTLDKMLKGGKRGPAVVPFHPEQSLIYQAITAAGQVPVMPPFDRLGDDDIAAVKNWIYRGCQTLSMSGNAP